MINYTVVMLGLLALLELTISLAIFLRYVKGKRYSESSVMLRRRSFAFLKIFIGCVLIFQFSFSLQNLGGSTFSGTSYLIPLLASLAIINGVLSLFWKRLPLPVNMLKGFYYPLAIMALLMAIGWS